MLYNGCWLLELCLGGKFSQILVMYEEDLLHPTGVVQWRPACQPGLPPPSLGSGQGQVRHSREPALARGMAPGSFETIFSKGTAPKGYV